MVENQLPLEITQIFVNYWSPSTEKSWKQSYVAHSTDFHKEGVKSVKYTMKGQLSMIFEKKNIKTQNVGTESTEHEEKINSASFTRG